MRGEMHRLLEHANSCSDGGSIFASFGGGSGCGGAFGVGFSCYIQFQARSRSMIGQINVKGGAWGNADQFSQTMGRFPLPLPSPPLALYIEVLCEYEDLDGLRLKGGKCRWNRLSTAAHFTADTILPGFHTGRCRDGYSTGFASAAIG